MGPAGAAIGGLTGGIRLPADHHAREPRNHRNPIEKRMHTITLGHPSGGSTMSTTIESTPTRKPNPTKPRPLPQWKILVHNDDVNTYGHVIRSFMDILRMEVTTAMVKTTEVDRTGAAVVCVTHREHAELIQGQLQSKSLTVSIEPDA